MGTRPNLTIKIYPENDGVGSYDYAITDNQSGVDFEKYFSDDRWELDDLLDELKLRRKRKPYLLLFVDAGLVKEEETDDDGWATGFWYHYFDYKSVKVARV